VIPSQGRNVSVDDRLRDVSTTCLGSPGGKQEWRTAYVVYGCETPFRVSCVASCVLLAWSSYMSATL